MKIKNFQSQENQRFSGPENSENECGVFLAFKLQIMGNGGKGV